MAEKDPRDEIPDLVIPARRRSTDAMPAVAVPAPAAAPPPPADFDDGMEFEHAAPMSMQGSMSSGRGAAIELGSSDGDFEIERGGGGGPTIQAAAPASRRAAVASTGLELAHNRLAPKAVVDDRPSFALRFFARAIPLVFFVGTLVGLVRALHKPGGHTLAKMMPHAFDATSTAQSGGFAGAMLVLAIAVGAFGLKVRPRSNAMLVSGGVLVIVALAMVTVALVSTDEHPAPADGALLVPWLMPVALLALAFGALGRGPAAFMAGGARRLNAVLAGALGGALAFAAIEISSLASRLP